MKVTFFPLSFYPISFYLCAFLLMGPLNVTGNERYTDPDGCFSCHALSGLQYIDKQGLLRDASIDQSHYYSSLHGSVPCKDCHRQIRYYPHKEENGEVDCAESCHVNEPSNGEAFSHKEVVKEFNDSSHGSGASKGFTGANRLAEEDRSQSPSCRRCHSNTAYIEPHQLDNFMESFQHTNAECGTCHQGEAWRNQLSGHILRRFIGARWKKTASNKICNDCHADLQPMQKVKLEDPNTGEKYPSSYRWQHASASYAKSLHGRLLVTGDEAGASCLDCHAPNGDGLRHGVMNAKNVQSPTHPEKLAETCGQSSCHEFAKDKKNYRFNQTDMHSLNHLPQVDFQLMNLLDEERLESNWYRAFIALGVICMVFIFGHISQLLFAWGSSDNQPLFGSGRFKKVMLGRTQNIKKKMASKRNTSGSNKKSITKKGKKT